MKKIIFIFLSIIFISSCYANHSVIIYSVNQWCDFNNHEHNYSKIKFNVSTYFAEDYLVLGVALGEKYNVYINKKFIFSYYTKLDYNLIEYYDSTGVEVIFDENNRYTFNTSRTIKIDYSKTNEISKEKIENNINFEINGESFVENNSKEIQKVQFGETLVYDDIK